jgi:hypothetical protein
MHRGRDGLPFLRQVPLLIVAEAFADVHDAETD